MPTIDSKPDPQRSAMEVAGDCALRGESEAARTIRRLVTLSRALQKITIAYRLRTSPPDSALDDAARLSHIIE